jgi:uncharacterized protein (TIGR00269 family)
MRCRRCKEKACIDIPRHNAGFCRECFFRYFNGQVKQAINGRKLLASEDNVLMAVSGGKDSLVLWEVLMDMGYRATGLHIDLGIGGYSIKSREKAENFARGRSAELIVYDVSKELGCALPEITNGIQRKECSACGVIKRHIFNSVALEKGFTAVATGHNLDDEAARLLGNLLGWQIEYLSHQSPRLDDNPPALVKKVKPLFRLTEREVAAYAFMKGIDYIMDECPYSVDARSIRLKNTLNKLEKESPGTKHNFYLGFLKNAELFTAADKTTLNVCPECGKPTSGGACAFCRLLQRVGQGRSL